MTNSSAITLLLLTSFVRVAAGQDAISNYKEKLEISDLHRRANAVLPHDLAETSSVDATRLYSDLNSMWKASQDVALIHIERAISQLSKDGAEPTTFYEGLVLQSWKGAGQRTLRFSGRTGMVVFEDGSRASKAFRNFRPLKPAGRYVVFTAFCQDDSRTCGPICLAGDGLQGAFEIDNETVVPDLHQGALYSRYKGTTATEFFQELKTLATTKR